MLAEIQYYSRLALGIRQVTRTPLPPDPESFIRRQFVERERRFLEVAERVVFANPAHPSHVMFRIAGCALGDLARHVEQDGLVTTLTTLRGEGVYLSHDEWRGTTPIVRAGREISFGANGFRNPFVKGWSESQSSGSTGRPMTTAHSTEARVHTNAHQFLRFREFGLSDRAWITLRPILPATTGLNSALRGRVVGTPVDRWFSVGSTLADYGHYRAATWAMVTLGNLAGARAPYPTFLPPDDFGPVAAHIARRRREGRASVVQGILSPLVRVAAAAIEQGHDITGTVFLCGGEALTPGKREVFERAGCLASPSYALSEVGHVGLGCPEMTGNCVHLLEDAVAAITHRRRAPYADEVEVDSLHFTSLLPYAANFFINVEMDDEGTIEPVTCNCVFSRIGFTRRIRHIAAFGKLTPQGMNFHGTELVPVLEEVLPARFGGRPGDYQLVECEAPNKQTELRLHISPRVGLTDPERVRDAFVEHMRPRRGGALATRLWLHSNGVRAVISEPHATPTGKVHAVRLLRASSSPGRTRVGHEA